MNSLGREEAAIEVILFEDKSKRKNGALRVNSPAFSAAIALKERSTWLRRVNFVSKEDEAEPSATRKCRKFDEDGIAVSALPLRIKLPMGTVAKMLVKMLDMALSPRPLSEHETFSVALLSALRPQRQEEIEEGSGQEHRVEVSAVRGVIWVSPQVPFLMYFR